MATKMGSDDEPIQRADVLAQSTLEALKPIRDLAQNWDIDIDKCLREYIEEVLPEIDLGTQNASKINFAEAALVLQNSSHVYSRKVEHLYNLVYQALEGMTSAGQNSTNNRKGKSQDIDDFFDFDPHQEFLLLDDILPTDDTDDCRQINLNENHEENVNYSGMVSSIDISNTIVEHQVKAASMVTSLRLADGNCEMGANGCLFLPGTQEAASRMESTDTDPTAAHHNDYPMDDGFDDDDDDLDGAGFALADNDFRENYTGDNSQERRNVSFAPDVIPRKNDPWELLDPHKVDKKSKPKPLRIGKTIRLPEGIDSLPSDCVNGTSTQRVARVQPKPLPPQVPVISIASQTFQATLRKRRHESPSKDDPIPEAPTAPIQGLAFGNEFAYIAKANAKRKAAERREKRKLERKQPMSQEAYEEYEDDDHDDGGFPMYDDDDNDVDESTGNTGFVSLDQAYKGNSDLNDDNNDETEYVQSFEDLCRAHLRAFAKGAEKYAAETNLSRRVGDWQERLVPVLEEEEKRSEFDIHIYGETVIARVEKEVQLDQSAESGKLSEKIIDFKVVTRECPRYEVCRMFLATLSLCNSGNIHIDNGENHDELGVQLLRSDIDRPMRTYLAPSVIAGET